MPTPETLNLIKAQCQQIESKIREYDREIDTMKKAGLDTSRHEANLSKLKQEYQKIKVAYGV